MAITISAARDSLETFENILSKQKERQPGDAVILRDAIIPVFRRLKADPTNSPEKIELLKKVNDISYRFLSNIDHFSCCGVYHRIFGPSYYEQLAERIKEEDSSPTPFFFLGRADYNVWIND